jgi:hypothetical protein
MKKVQLMKTGRKPPVDIQKLERIVEVLPSSPFERLEVLLIFDARAISKETRQELLRLLPELVHVRRAWKAEYMECGCICCRAKKTEYGAGGFCNTCAARIYNRMRSRFRKAMQGRNVPAEIEAFKDTLQLRYNAAQRLFNGEE